LKTSPPTGAIFSELHGTGLEPRCCCPLTAIQRGTAAAAVAAETVWSVDALQCIAVLENLLPQ